MKKPIIITAALMLLLFGSCQRVSQKETVQALLKEGIWRVSMALPDAELPFNFTLSFHDSAYEMVVMNDLEKIKVTDIKVIDDSLFINMPIFQSSLVGAIHNDSLISGSWINYSKGKDYQIPFEASHGADERFKIAENSSGPADISGKWEVTFSPESEDPCKAIGAFKQEGDRLTGTFITETGDYRFLEGKVTTDSLFLSCFDGSHAFLFKAGLKNDQLNGQFWSGKHWKENWTAMRNENFELTHPDSLTFLKDGYSELSFQFPNLDSVMVSLDDERYQNKAVLIQIMGSWCPNCADETAFLTELYDQFNPEGLEVIALAYEKGDDFDNSVAAVKKMRDHFGADYEFLIAGPANKQEAQKTLPMLNHIMSYPTCIFIDKNKNIRKIRTGFYGPGTGDIYHTYVEEMVSFTQELLHEES